MTATLLYRSPTAGACPLRWCMNASGCTHNDPDDGRLHYGRPSSIDSYNGDRITVQPFQFSDSDTDTGPRVEVGADDTGRVKVPFTPAEAVTFAAAVRDATNGHVTEPVTITAAAPDSPVCSATIRVLPEAVRIGRFEYWFVELTFCDPSEPDSPVVVQALDADAVAYARYVEAAAAEVAA